MKSSVAIQCGSARIKHKTDGTTCTNQDPSTSNTPCNSQEYPFKSHPRESGDDHPPQVKKRSFWQFVGTNMETLPFAITRDIKKKEIEAWSRIYPINNHFKQPLITFLGMFRQFASAERPKENSKVHDTEEKLLEADTGLHKTNYADKKTRNASPHIRSGIETIAEKKPNVTPILDKVADDKVGIISNNNCLEEHAPDLTQKTKDVMVEHEIGQPQHNKLTNKEVTQKHFPKIAPVKAEQKNVKHCFSDNKEDALGHEVAIQLAKHRRDTAASTDVELRSLGSISDDTAITAVSGRSKSRLVRHSVQQINIYSNSKKAISYLPVPKKVSEKSGGFDNKSNKSSPKNAVTEYRVGSPGPAISRTGLFCVVPNVARLRPLDPSFRKDNCKTLGAPRKINHNND